MANAAMQNNKLATLAQDVMNRNDDDFWLIFSFFFTSWFGLLFDQTVQGATHEVKTAVANILIVSICLLSFGTLSKKASVSLVFELGFQPMTKVCKTRKTTNMTNRTQGMV
jgi:hypothetical protein